MFPSTQGVPAALLVASHSQLVQLSVLYRLCAQLLLPLYTVAYFSLYPSRAVVSLPQLAVIRSLLANRATLCRQQVVLHPAVLLLLLRNAAAALALLLLLVVGTDVAAALALLLLLVVVRDIAAI
jgi:hypothetical protein